MKATVKKKSEATINEHTDKEIMNDEAKDHSNDPAFIRMANESKAFLEKHGFPEELLRKRM